MLVPAYVCGKLVYATRCAVVSMYWRVSACMWACWCVHVCAVVNVYVGVCACVLVCTGVYVYGCLCSSARACYGVRVG